ncbi:hypothetical protein ACTXT7_011727 [Hymenolepis weldensis]
MLTVCNVFYDAESLLCKCLLGRALFLFSLFGVESINHERKFFGEFLIIRWDRSVSNSVSEVEALQYLNCACGPSELAFSSSLRSWAKSHFYVLILASRCAPGWQTRSRRKASWTVFRERCTRARQIHPAPDYLQLINGPVGIDLSLINVEPNSFVMLQRIVQLNLEQDLGINLTLSQEERITPPPPAPVIKDLKRLPKITQWTIQRKSWLDQHLEVEMRADEPNWMNYRPFEKSVLDSLITKILVEVFDEVYDSCEKKVAKEIYEEDMHLISGNLLEEVVKNPDTNNGPRNRHPSSTSDLPLVLASDNEKLRNQDINFIESSSFVQTEFRSSRGNKNVFKTPSEATGGGLNVVTGTSGEYDAMVRERAHEAAIFGTGRGQPLGALPSDEGFADAGPKIVPTKEVVKEIIHPNLKKDKVAAYREWASRLNDLANARRQIRQAASSK